MNQEEGIIGSSENLSGEVLAPDVSALILFQVGNTFTVLLRTLIRLEIETVIPVKTGIATYPDESEIILNYLINFIGRKPVFFIQGIKIGLLRPTEIGAEEECYDNQLSQRLQK